MNELGDLRPSQLIYTFGVGALVDLPNVSALIMGLDDWDTRFCKPISEDRLLATLQRRLGGQLSSLNLPPIQYEDLGDAVGQPAIGVPVVPFPRWLRCPVCDMLATIDSGAFVLRQDRYRPDKTRYVHASCTRASEPTALAVRFLIACREGHLSDFPWIEYVHEGVVPCKPARLTLREYGASGDASDIVAKCIECGQERRMGDAFDRSGTRARFICSGHHPHLRQTSAAPCEEEARAVLLGASNLWFPLVLSAISIPRAADKLTQLVDEKWPDLKDVDSLGTTRYATAPGRMPAFADFTPEQVWAAIQKKKAALAEPPSSEIEDLKLAEWEVFSQPGKCAGAKELTLSAVAPPRGFEKFFEETVLVERIREVRALMGFTRIESKGDFVDAAYVDDERQTPLSRKPPEWLPASEVRGEGIFLRLKEAVLAQWQGGTEVRDLEKQFAQAHAQWRKVRKMAPNEAAFPGIRFVLLHSLAHALMRQIAIDCGYSAASLRERIYCAEPGSAEGPMAGFLIYTAATDSEGTLGGLVSLGQPDLLGMHLDQAFENLHICASDPLCAEHRPAPDGRGIHGATCHACLFGPETSCERGNRYLDRAVLIRTFADGGTAFFEP